MSLLGTDVSVRSFHQRRRIQIDRFLTKLEGLSGQALCEIGPLLKVKQRHKTLCDEPSVGSSELLLGLLQFRFLLYVRLREGLRSHWQKA
jgi:hypothetical protein